MTNYWKGSIIGIQWLKYRTVQFPTKSGTFPYVILASEDVDCLSPRLASGGYRVGAFNVHVLS